MKKMPMNTAKFLARPARKSHDGVLLETSVIVDAPLARVWETLCGFDRYQDWNPFMVAIDGKCRRGARLLVQVAPPGQALLTFRPKITHVRKRREMRWSSAVLAPGLFGGEHRFRLDPVDKLQCRLIQENLVSGVLLEMFAPALLASARRGMDTMNAALKLRSECAWRRAAGYPTPKHLGKHVKDPSIGPIPTACL